MKWFFLIVTGLWLPFIVFGHLKTTSLLVEILKNLALGISALITAFVAVQGLDSWRRQQKLKDCDALAKEAFEAAIELRDAVQAGRYPFIGGYIPVEKAFIPLDDEPQNSQATVRMGKLNLEFLTKVESEAYLSRCERVQKALGKLDALKPRSRIYWGKDFELVTEPLEGCAANFLHAIEEYLKMLLYEASHPDCHRNQRWDKESQDWIDSMIRRKDLGRMPSVLENDPFSKQINNDLEKILNFLRPKFL